MEHILLPASSVLAFNGLGLKRSEDFMADALGLSIKGLGSGFFFDCKRTTKTSSLFINVTPVHVSHNLDIKGRVRYRVVTII